MRHNSRINLDTHARLGHEVMSYLKQFKDAWDAEKHPSRGEAKTITDNPRLYDWKLRGTESDNTPAPKTSDDDEPKLRVSPLLSKQAAAKEGVDFKLDSDGYRVPVNKPMAKTVSEWNKSFGSPIISSVVLGTIPAAAYWGIHKYLNPDKEGTEGQTIEASAGELLAEDEAAGRQLKDREWYIQEAINQQRRERLKTALLLGLGSAAFLHLKHINPSDWSELYRYPETKYDKAINSDIKKEASMLGSPNAMSFNALQSAIAFNPNLAPSIKDSAMAVLNFNPSPAMTSTNIINNAIYSGESARTGLPMGRIITSAAVDAAAGYGLGKLFGVGSPKRAGLLAGIGSALYNALSYTSRS